MVTDLDLFHIELRMQIIYTLNTYLDALFNWDCLYSSGLDVLVDHANHVRTICIIVRSVINAPRNTINRRNTTL
jgi:hypothetical protein